MIEIIKVPTRYNVTCPSCISELSFEKEDIKTAKAISKRYIKCPNCRRSINISEYSNADNTEYMFDRVSVDKFTEIKQSSRRTKMAAREIGFVAKVREEAV